MPAKVRVDTWIDGVAARAGVGLFTSAANGQGYNLVFHNDHNTVEFLDDMIEWGPSYSFSWSNNTWYWFKLKYENGTMYGKVWADGASEPDTWPYSWGSPKTFTRTGFPALNSGSTYSGAGASASFDDISVTAVP